MSIRKADDQYAVGLRPDGTAADRLRPLVDPNALFELLPQRVWPWIPIGVIVMAVSVVAATWALAAALT